MKLEKRPTSVKLNPEEEAWITQHNSLDAVGKAERDESFKARLHYGRTS